MGKKVLLATQYYVSTNEARQKEIDYCIAENLANDEINCYLFFFENEESRVRFKETFLEHTHYRSAHEMRLGRSNDYFSINMIDVNARPTFDYIFDYVEIVNRSVPYVNIIANTDIFFDPLNIRLIKENLEPSEMWGLSRWDVKDDKGTLELFNRPDSQDTFIYIGAMKQRFSAPFVMGSLGQDNRLMYLFKEAGYDVANPSHTIKSYHLHLTDFRTYLDKDGKRLQKSVDGPYLTMPPVEILIKEN